MMELSPLAAWLAPGSAFGPGPGMLLLLAALVIVDGLLSLSIPLQLKRTVPDRLGKLLAGWLDLVEGRLNRRDRSRANRLVRGAVLALGVALAAVLIGVILQTLVGGLAEGTSLAALLILALVALLAGQRHSLMRLVRARALLAAGKAAPARQLLQETPGLRLHGSDDHAVARAAISLGVRGFSADLVGRLFWFLLAGLPGLMLSAAMAGMARGLAARSRKSGAFALAAERLDALLGFIPERLAALVLLIAAPFVPGLRLSRGLRAFFLSGTAKAVLAALHDLSLDGERAMGPRFVGEGRARAGLADMARGLGHLAASALLVAAGLAALLLLAD